MIIFLLTALLQAVMDERYLLFDFSLYLPANRTINHLDGGQQRSWQ
ncbi:hypothetical protein [Halomicronema hongdechloris]